MLECVTLVGVLVCYILFQKITFDCRSFVKKLVSVSDTLLREVCINTYLFVIMIHRNEY